VNAASQEGGGIASGEIVTILGAGIGPSQLTRGHVSDGRLATEAAGTRVLFNGIPGPLISVSSREITAIVPYAVGGQSRTVDVRVECHGGVSELLTVPLLSARPGFFAQNDGSPGDRHGIIYNEDGTMNSRSNPARHGSIISAYLTGEGLVTPAVPDGAIVDGVLPRPVQEVSATFGDLESEWIPAEVVHVGGVKGQVAGLFQINVQVPELRETPYVWLEVSVGRERAAAFVALR
jgi:uncharacterized protein (TIGR03437 family)